MVSPSKTNPNHQKEEERMTQNSNDFSLQTGRRRRYYKTPNGEDNDFKVKASLVNMVNQNQYGGSADEDPNQHVTTFKEMCDTIEMEGLKPTALKLITCHKFKNTINESYHVYKYKPVFGN